MNKTATTDDFEKTSSTPQASVKYQFAEFVLCSEQNVLMQGDRLVPLNLKAIQCLKLLVTNANKVVFRSSFFDEIWGDCFVGDGVLSVNISCLRKVVGKSAIKTYSGKGYSFKEPVKVVVASPTVTIKPVNEPFVSGERKKRSLLDRMKDVFEKTMV